MRGNGVIGFPRLAEAFDREKSFRRLGQVPIREKLRAVKDYPFGDQSCCRDRQMTGQHDTVGDPDLGLVTRIERVKVRRSVVLPVHVDGDAVERRNPRHGSVAPMRLVPLLRLVPVGSNLRPARVLVRLVTPPVAEDRLFVGRR